MTDIYQSAEGTVTLDPEYSWGLVKTEPEWREFHSKDYIAILVKELEPTIPAEESMDIFMLKNFTKPTGVFFFVKVVVKVVNKGDWFYFGVNNGSSTIAGDVIFGFAKPGSGNVFDETEDTIYVRHYDANGNLKATYSVSQGSYKSILFDSGEAIEIEAKVSSEYIFRAYNNLSYERGEFVIRVFESIKIDMHHDGTVERGSDVTCSFDLYDGAGAEQWASFIFHGVVSPHGFVKWSKASTYRPGEERVYEFPIGDWILKSGVLCYVLFELRKITIEGLKDLAPSELPNYFEKFTIGVEHKSVAYDQIVAFPSLSLEEIDTLPKKSAEEKLPDGDNGGCYLYLDILPKKHPDFTGRRLVIESALYVSF